MFKSIKLNREKDEAILSLCLELKNEICTHIKLLVETDKNIIAQVMDLRNRVAQLEEINSRPAESDEERMTMNQLMDEWMNGKDDGDA
jgi:hypothetical protein